MSTKAVARFGLATSAAVIGLGVAAYETCQAIAGSRSRRAAKIAEPAPDAAELRSAGSHVPTALSADLATLSAELGDTSVDLQGLLEDLADRVRATVSCYLGMSATIVVDGHPMTMTVMDESADPADVASSARLPLTALIAAEPGCIIFYAAHAGAFVDLAASLNTILGLGQDVLVIDENLVSAHTSAPDSAGLSGLADLSAINQACGILIGRGLSPDAARTELLNLALAGAVTEPVAAERLIAEVSGSVLLV